MGTIANVLVGVAAVTWDFGGTPVVLGYTEDGVTMTISTDFFDVNVEEVIGSIHRVMTHQEIVVTLNMAESSLANMLIAVPGSSLAGAVLTLGNGSLGEEPLQLVGTNPAGNARTILLTEVNPVGEVGIPYKKGAVSIVPVSFKALVQAAGTFGTLTDT